MEQSVKFMWNGIKVDGVLYLGWYSASTLKNCPEGTITIYARNYHHFPKIGCLTIENGSDSMTDYFEEDRIRVNPGNPWYPSVLEAFNKAEAHFAKRAKKREAISDG
jgi:hypothetical protein